MGTIWALAESEHVARAGEVRLDRLAALHRTLAEERAPAAAAAHLAGGLAELLGAVALVWLARPRIGADIVRGSGAWNGADVRLVSGPLARRIRRQTSAVAPAPVAPAGETADGPRAASAVGQRTILVPLCHAGGTIGVALLRRERPFNRDEVACAELVGSQAASILVSRWARAGARDRMVETLLTVLRERDIETGDHVNRAAAYTESLLRACDADPSHHDWHDTMRGALLHDLGKISVPDDALREPGPLSDEQWSAMRRHALVSYRLLHGLDGLAGAAEVAYAHHEHYDGRGYPRGLAGAAIPFGARLFAVADAFDAITSDRPYRAARSAAAARDEIERCSGTQFDPAIVAAFRRAYPELERRADR